MHPSDIPQSTFTDNLLRSLDTALVLEAMRQDMLNTDLPVNGTYMSLVAEMAVTGTDIHASNAIRLNSSSKEAALESLNNTINYTMEGISDGIGKLFHKLKVAFKDYDFKNKRLGEKLESTLVLYKDIKAKTSKTSINHTCPDSVYIRVGNNSKAVTNVSNLSKELGVLADVMISLAKTAVSDGKSFSEFDETIMATTDAAVVKDLTKKLLANANKISTAVVKTGHFTTNNSKNPAILTYLSKPMLANTSLGLAIPNFKDIDPDDRSTVQNKPYVQSFSILYSDDVKSYDGDVKFDGVSLAQIKELLDTVADIQSDYDVVIRDIIRVINGIPEMFYNVTDKAANDSKDDARFWKLFTYRIYVKNCYFLSDILNGGINWPWSVSSQMVNLARGILNDYSWKDRSR